MEILILFGVVGVPLIAFGFFAMYKAQKEERKEHQLQEYTQRCQSPVQDD